MSPEVVGANFALAASDMWSLGVMLFMMVSGGLSPFWAGNDYKTEARVLGKEYGCFKASNKIDFHISVGDYRLDLPHFYSVSREAKDLITRLIVLNPESRSSADQGKAGNYLLNYM